MDGLQYGGEWRRLCSGALNVKSDPPTIAFNHFNSSSSTLETKQRSCRGHLQLTPYSLAAATEMYAC